ncbi:hypothetical protein LTR92_011765 [Exophiala xenobiotica]|nr:hypothetical protein LTR92_011765 [Exophiala xenobiotica]
MLFYGPSNLQRSRTYGKCQSYGETNRDFADLTSARTTAAAPGYFRPKEIAPFGALQDGGISANKPTDAALWELNCIWPETNGPHLVLSVGTGCQKSLSHELGPYRGVWLDGFIPRILRAFLSSPSLDAESSWMALWNRLDANTRERYHRLSCEFNGELSDLDDSSQIPRLIHMTKSSTVDYDTLKCKLWASRFILTQLKTTAHSWLLHLSRQYSLPVSRLSSSHRGDLSLF